MGPADNTIIRHILASTAVIMRAASVRIIRNSTIIRRTRWSDRGSNDRSVDRDQLTRSSFFLQTDHNVPKYCIGANCGRKMLGGIEQRKIRSSVFYFREPKGDSQLFEKTVFFFFKKNSSTNNTCNLHVIKYIFISDLSYWG